MTWENTTFVGSAYEEQYNPTTQQIRHRPMGQTEQPWRPGPAPDRPVGRYKVVQVLEAEDQVTVFVADADDGGRTITNDAEAVVQAICACWGENVRIVYRDTDGRWDELRQLNGNFVDFGPYDGVTPC